ncbi:helicase-related protein [Alicyclobacillus suci]|uniref:helicase-related protein n=1 Tax=Alicyclobacillus suci TaxID=2816080 RepID=UPI001A8F6D7B|nr:helicase-related protein [Alicyclobacillus suci]
MKILEYQSDLHWYDAAAHLLITRPIPGKEYEELIAASLIDIDQVTRGIAARALKGEFLHVRPERYASIETRVKCDRNNYRLIHRPVGKTTHTLILHKSAVDEIIDSDRARSLILPDGGDIATLFAKHFAHDFSLPYVEEWGQPLWDACVQRELVEPLNVWSDPNVKFWRDVQAYQLSPELNEEQAKEILSKLLAKRKIELPQGITEAPALSEVLGEYKKDAEDGDQAELMTYLQTFAGHLAATIEEMAKPLHDLDKPIHPAIATMKRVPFLAQAHVAQAAVNGLKSQKGVIISSDMGTGKSISSLAVLNTLAAVKNEAQCVVNRGKRSLSVLMLVPAITIPKWVEDEIKATLHNPIITVFKNWKDVVQWRDKRKKHPLQNGQIEIMLLGRDTSKLGMPKAPSLIYKPQHVYTFRPSRSEYPMAKPMLSFGEQGIRYSVGTADRGHVVKLEDVWLCPECHAVQTKTDEESIKEARAASGDNEYEMLLELKLGFHDLANGRRPYEATGVGDRAIMHDQYHFHSNLGNYHCSACNANLMRDVKPEVEKVSNLTKRRLQPSWFIQRYLKGYIDLLVVDEVHEYAGLSGQGESLGAIISAAKRVLALTGTLSKGTASSLFYLLWRLVPGQMLKLGFDHKSLGKFVSLYGAQEQRGRYSEDDVQDDGTFTRRKIVMNPPTEIPGLSPKLFANLLSDKTIFLELGDLGLPLVELEEKPVFVDMDEDPPHRYQYSKFHNELESKMKKAYIGGNKHAYARFIPSVVNAANQPHKEQYVPLNDEGIAWIPTHDENELNAKERRLLEDIRDDLVQGRRCVVFVRYSGKEYQQDERIHKILTREGIRSRLLKASVKPQDRVAWISKAVEDDIQVIVSNVTLVQVGIDMLDFPSLNFFQLTDQINTLRQASRRAWRIKQSQKCTARFYITNGSYEMVQFRRMMKRRLSAMLLEGRADKSDLAMFGEKDELSSSTFSIASCLGDVNDLESKWRTIADKDIPQGVVMLKEDEFKVEISKAMKRLAEETRRAAGLQEVDIIPLTNTETQLDLFNLPDFEESQDTPKPLVVQEEPMTVGALRKQMGFVVKAKKKMVSDDQILLFAL